MEGDLIIANIDPLFRIAQDALEELDEQKRLEVLASQRSWLHAIQSNVSGDDNIFKFGQAFGRTISVVFRMVMLRAVQIKETSWPTLGELTPSRNKESLRFAVSPQGSVPFKLLGEEDDTKETAKVYYGKYDHAFPHHLLESELPKNKGKMVNLGNKMLIFRDDFSEVIEIITEAHAAMHPPDWEAFEFDSYVEVKCIQKIIKPGDDGECFKQLKEDHQKETKQKARVTVRVRSEVLNRLKKDKDKNDKDKKDEDKKNEDKKDEDKKDEEGEDKKDKKNEDKKDEDKKDEEGEDKKDKDKKDEDKKDEDRKDEKGKDKKGKDKTATKA
jgi:hypothetical protein